MATRYVNATPIRSNYTTEFKAKVAAAYLNRRGTTAEEIATRFGVGRELVYKWGKMVTEALADKRSYRAAA